ncbi:MAG: hypothetical protein AAF797_07745 [Planctomycetota bacterium]
MTGFFFTGLFLVVDFLVVFARVVFLVTDFLRLLLEVFVAVFVALDDFLVRVVFFETVFLDVLAGVVFFFFVVLVTRLEVFAAVLEAVERVRGVGFFLATLGVPGRGVKGRGRGGLAGCRDTTAGRGGRCGRGSVSMSDTPRKRWGSFTVQRVRAGDAPVGGLSRLMRGF